MKKPRRNTKNPDNDPRGVWNIDPLTLAFDRIQRKNLFYPIFDPDTGRFYPCDPNRVWAYASELNPETRIETFESETMEEWIRRKKIVFPKEERVAIWNSMEELVKAIKAGEVPVTPKKKNPLLSLDTPNLEFWLGKPVGFGRPGFKKHWSDLRSHINPVGSWIARLNEDGNEDDYVTLRSKEAGEGTGVIEKIFGNKVFNNPKPPSLMQQLVEQSTVADDIVLDFFAGSGTTAHATLLQNAQDSQERRFIMVSNTERSEKEPDKNLCRNVCAKRISMVINGYGDNPAIQNNFAYLRTRRIAQGRMLGIEHAQVWSALQMMHRETLLPFCEEPYLISRRDDEALVYAID